MTLADDLRAAPTTAKPCIVGRYLAERTEAEQLLVKNAFADRGWSLNSIYRVLRQHGYEGGPSSLYMHRVGACPCRHLN